MQAFPTYPNYESNAPSWLDPIPVHWETTRLKFIVTANDETLDETFDPDAEIEYVDISSVSLLGGIEKTDSITFGKAPSRARRLVKDGDVIISTVRTYLKAIAAIKMPKDNLVVSTGFAVLRPQPGLYPDYASYFVQSSGFVGEVVARSVGVSYPAINPSELVCIAAILPPMNEQMVIARYLDFKTAQIDALIAKKRALLEKLAEKRTSMINRAVAKGLNLSVPTKDSGASWLGRIPDHWNAKRLRFLTTMSGGMTPSTSNPAFWDGDIPWITPKDMKREVLFASEDTLTEEALKETGITLYDAGKVLIVVRGMILAHTFPVAINAVNSTVNQDMKAISTVMNSEYLALLLRGIQPLILSLVEEAAHGTKVLRTDVFKNLMLPVPPLSEQGEIVSRVSELTNALDSQGKQVQTPPQQNLWAHSGSGSRPSV